MKRLIEDVRDRALKGYSPVFRYDPNSGIIWADGGVWALTVDNDSLQVRGWGNLTEFGGMGLSEDEAVEIVPKIMVFHYTGDKAGRL